MDWRRSIGSAAGQSENRESIGTASGPSHTDLGAIIYGVQALTSGVSGCMSAFVMSVLPLNLRELRCLGAAFYKGIKSGFHRLCQNVFLVWVYACDLVS